MLYRKVRKYKYKLEDDYSWFVNIKTSCASEYIDIITGILFIKENYQWDGPSGPTIDTKNFMEGSLVHDALYQLIREQQLDPSLKKRADQILREICLLNGMSKIRAGWVYWAVRLFGHNSIVSQKNKYSKIYST